MESISLPSIAAEIEGNISNVNNDKRATVKLYWYFMCIGSEEKIKYWYGNGPYLISCILGETGQGLVSNGMMTFHHLYYAEYPLL